jgi:2-polyprenyl-6-methoxyphenol hydroxylase-like FAD-dependent oxidoreductase
MSVTPPVLIVGAGPAGLLLSLQLHALGTPHRLVERAPAIPIASRAIIVHARTLELYARVSPGLAERVHASGLDMTALNIWSDRQRMTTVDFRRAGHGLTAWAGSLCISQDVHEQILIDELTRVGGTLERGVELVALEQHSDTVEVGLRHADGHEERSTYAYVAGCDGGHSAVRHLAGIAMPGGTYPLRFFVADVVPAAPSPMLEKPAVNWCSSKEDFILALPHPTALRIVGIAPEHGEVDWEACLPTVRRNLPDVPLGEVRWFATYRSHHRVADTFRRDRVFLVGDAGHLHSPVGGQGMNTGLGDAVNLSWKLAAAVQHPTHAHVQAWLDSYDAERRAFARTLVRTTDATFTGMTSHGWRGWFLRRVFMPYIVPALVGTLVRWIGPKIIARVSQLTLNYRAQGVGLNAGSIGGVRAGDRMPWVSGVGVGAVEWEAVVFGTASGRLGQMGVKFREEKWTEEARAKGLVRNAVYLVRPDGYVGAAVASDASRREFEEWMAKWVV